MKVLVLGATGRSGRVIVDELISRNHDVTAFVRNTAAFGLRSNVRTAAGDALDPHAIRAAVRGHDAVVIALGISENPLMVRFRGPTQTSMHVRSIGTQNVIDAMRLESVRKLIVQTTHGAGNTNTKLSRKWRLLFWLLLKPQIADTEEQERIVQRSPVDWVVVRPVSLIDGDRDTHMLVSPSGATRSMEVPRQAVARAIVDNIEGNAHLHEYLSVSA